MTAGLVCFSHGQESGPWGTKIRAMAETVRTAGWEVESIDYQGIKDPRQRVRKLVDYCHGLDTPPLLVGSSMGGFVALGAAAQRPVRGLFLLAPAFFLPGLEEHLPGEFPQCPTLIVHGWRDDVVPWQGSLQYASNTRSSLVLLDGDHRLTANLPVICDELAGFIQRLEAPGSAP